MLHTHSLHQVWLMSFPSCLCFTGEEWTGRVRPAMSLTRTTHAPSTHGSLSATSTPPSWRRPTSRSSSPSTARSWAVRCTRASLSSSTSVKGTHGRPWQARTPGSSQDSRWVSSFPRFARLCRTDRQGPALPEADPECVWFGFVILGHAKCFSVFWQSVEETNTVLHVIVVA